MTDQARVAALEAALRDEADWHEAEAKALSKQPPGGDRDWRFMEHREHADSIRAALDALPAPAPQTAGEVVELAVWEYPEGDLRFARPNCMADCWASPWKRLGTVTLPIKRERGE